VKLAERNLLRREGAETKTAAQNKLQAQVNP